jgi:copper homeostasis protein (lipoprotein)
MPVDHRSVAAPFTARLAGAAALALAVAACGPAEAPSDAAPAGRAGPAAPSPAAQPAPLAAASAASTIALPATFAGSLPCADCEGIDTTLTLEADFRYRLRSRYLGKAPGEDTFVEVGRFAISDAGTRLALHGGNEGPAVFAIQGSGRLARLDTGGQAISSPLNYTLARTSDVDPVAEPAQRLGLFTYLADAASFVDCATEERLPVAMAAGYPPLEQAYTAAGAGGTPRLVRLAGHVEARVGMEEALGPQPTLVVDRFGELVGKEVRCQRARAPLAGTRWRLESLGDRAVTAAPGAGPTLEFDPGGARLGGSTGCNAISGDYDYSVASGALTVGAVTTATGECRAPVVDETDYSFAVQRATRATIDGEVLVLADDQGDLARFRADYPAPRP